MFIIEHVEIVQRLLQRLSSPDVLAFLVLVIDLSVYLRTPLLMGYAQWLNNSSRICPPDPCVFYVDRHCRMSRIEVLRNWNAPQLCGPSRKIGNCFMGYSFVVVSDHQPLKSISCSVGLIFECIVYTYTLEYRPGKNNGNADSLSRLPLPATEADTHPDARLSDPADIDVYLIGASSLQSQLAAPLCCRSCGVEELEPGVDFEMREKELRTAALTTNEESVRVW